MLRALAFASVLALAAGAALAQPASGPNGYGAQPPAQGSYPQPAQGAYPPPDQGYPQGGAPGYGQGAEGQGGDGQGGYGHGGGRWGGDPAMHALRQKMHAACATDLSTYCGGAEQGGHGAMRQCMMANQTRFSPPCQAAIADMHAHMGPPPGAPGAPMPPSSGYQPSQPPP